MRPDDVLEMKKHTPFQPFALQLSTGERYELRHPENIWVSRSVCYLATPSASDVIERVVHIALVHIVKMERLNEAKQEGRRKKGKAQ